MQGSVTMVLWQAIVFDFTNDAEKEPFPFIDTLCVQHIHVCSRTLEAMGRGRVRGGAGGGRGASLFTCSPPAGQTR